MGSSYPAGELLPGELVSAGLMAEFDDLKGLSQPYHFCDSSPSQLIWGNTAQKKQTQYLPQQAVFMDLLILSIYNAPRAGL